MAVKIFADIGSNLYPQLLKEKNLDIHVLKMSLFVDGEEIICYEDDADFEQMSKKFYEDVALGKSIKTSLINPATFLEEFKKETDKGNKIVCFTLAKGVSGTYQSAVTAAKEINEEKGETYVEVINTATAGLGEGMQAIHAYELVKQGKSFEEVVEEARTFRWKVRSEFTVDDITYLGKTGRVKPAIAKLANILRIKVLLNGSYESVIALTSKVIGRLKSLKKLASQCLEHVARYIKNAIYITHCNAKEDAEYLKNLLIKGGLKDIEVYPYDIFTGSHVGPGAIALFYVGENRDL